MSNKKIYAFYKGENFIAEGTIKEIVAETGKSRKQLHWYKTPIAHKRNKGNAQILIELEDCKWELIN